MTREELITSPEYWIVDIQTKLYDALETYRKDKGLNRTQLAAKLGFSKGYISQILNGDFDHRISKLVELSLKIGMAPDLHFKSFDEGIELHIADHVSNAKDASIDEENEKSHFEEQKRILEDRAERLQKLTYNELSTTRDDLHNPLNPRHSTLPWKQNTKFNEIEKRSNGNKQ